MGVHIGGKKLVIVKTEKKVYLPKNIDINFKHEIYFVIKYNELLVECTIKMKLVNSCPNISMEMIFLNTENSKTNEPHKCVLNL